MSDICFICQREEKPVERPWSWGPPRRACATHLGSLRLWDGTLLDDALARVAPGDGPLEGSLLSRIYNPVLIDAEGRGSVRAWCDFTGGGRCVLEDRFGAASHFEFWAFNMRPCVDALYLLWLATGPGSPPAAGGFGENAGVVYRALQGPSPERRGPMLADGLERLRGEWNTAERLRVRRATTGRLWPESNAELLQWLDSSRDPASDAAPGEGTTFFPSLHALGQRRFSDLEAEASPAG